MEKIVNALREKRETEKRKLRPDFGNDSPALSQCASNTVNASATPTFVQSEVPPSTMTIPEETNQHPPAVPENRLIKNSELMNSQESSKQSRHHRRKRSGTPSQ